MMTNIRSKMGALMVKPALKETLNHLMPVNMAEHRFLV